MQAEIWILHSVREVLCQESGLGVPEAAVVASDGTVGGTLYDGDSFLGPYDLPESGGWGKAGEIAKEQAATLGYALHYFAPSLDADLPDEDGSWP